MSLTRRAFAVGVAAVAAAPLAPRLRGALGTVHRARVSAPQAQDPTPEAQALAQVLRLRFPDRFTDAQYADILRDVDGGLRRARRLNEPVLHNWDEPDTVFRAYRGDD